MVNSGYKIENKYKIGDEVYLNENHLLHGIGKNVQFLETFANRGIVSQDFLGDNSNHAFCYNSAFWTVDGGITLRDFVKNYSGIVAKYNGNYEVIPYGELDNFVEKMKNVDHWLWTA